MLTIYRHHIPPCTLLNLHLPFLSHLGINLSWHKCAQLTWLRVPWEQQCTAPTMSPVKPVPSSIYLSALLTSLSRCAVHWVVSYSAWKQQILHWKLNSEGLCRKGKCLLGEGYARLSKVRNGRGLEIAWEVAIKLNAFQ